MPAVTYADPTTTRTPLHFDVMPPSKQASPIVNPPAKTKELFGEEKAERKQI
ncbi:hypothetical protein [Nostoc sp. LPT]|uniref:hypothetical protein n=1 Tax=Nostoc sp. LPT TaxID=2815387 RepID=UPI001D4E3438|nr:hypothetical protein [Nostoc sp. LPT]MBN4006771.1 hypothetical protein [Nostoc sp. LPT]